jgi:hypothetical protein
MTDQTLPHDRRERSRPAYNRRDPASAAARFDRLLKAASRGETLSQFARAEGITVQTLNSWLAARPAYADQVAHLRRGPKTVLTEAEAQKRLAAVRHKRAGMGWKQAARLAGVDVIRVQSWFYRVRPQVAAETAGAA